MSAPFDETELRRAAEKRASAILGFRYHLIVYLMVNGGLVALNLTTSHHYLWSLWSVLGWGIGLVSHGLSVYGRSGQSYEAMVQREMERLRRR